MTWSMFAIGWISVGEYTRSSAYFRRGYQDNAQRPFGVWSEFPHGSNYPGCVNFVTGAGGFLQSLVFGVPRMRLAWDGLHFNPAPLSSTGTVAKKLVLHSLHFRGSRIRQEIDSSIVSYELLDLATDAKALCLFVADRAKLTLEVGQPLRHDLRLPATIKECDDAVTTVLATTTTTSVTTTTRTTLLTSSTQELNTSPSPFMNSRSPVVLLLAVRNVDFSELCMDKNLKQIFQDEIRTVLAGALGATPGDIEVSLAAGSVAVRCTVTPPFGTTSEIVRRTAQSCPECISNLLATNLQKLPGIEAAATGVMTVSNIGLLPQVPENNPGGSSPQMVAMSTTGIGTNQRGSTSSKNLIDVVVGSEPNGRAVGGSGASRSGHRQTPLEVAQQSQEPSDAMSWWAMLAVGVVVLLVGFGVLLAVLLLRPAHEKKQFKRPDSARGPFDGTWMCLSAPTRKKGSKSSSETMVISGKTIRIHGAGSSVTMQMTACDERSFTMPNMHFPDELEHRVELIDGKLYWDGALVWARSTKRPSNDEQRPLLREELTGEV